MFNPDNIRLAVNYFGFGFFTFIFLLARTPNHTFRRKNILALYPLLAALTSFVAMISFSMQLPQSNSKDKSATLETTPNFKIDTPQFIGSTPYSTLPKDFSQVKNLLTPKIKNTGEQKQIFQQIDVVEGHGFDLKIEEAKFYKSYQAGAYQNLPIRYTNICIVELLVTNNTDFDYLINGYEFELEIGNSTETMYEFSGLGQTPDDKSTNLPTKLSRGQSKKIKSYRKCSGSGKAKLIHRTKNNLVLKLPPNYFYSSNPDDDLTKLPDIIVELIV